MWASPATLRSLLGVDPSVNPLEEAVERALKAFVYAPIGLLFDGPDPFATLVEKGRVQVNQAKLIGEFAVNREQRKACQRLDAGTGNYARPSAHRVPRLVETSRCRRRTRGGRAPATAADAFDSAGGPRPSGPFKPDLAIPDYDGLSASQVVTRLGGSAPDELEAVRVARAGQSSAQDHPQQGRADPGLTWTSPPDRRGRTIRRAGGPGHRGRRAPAHQAGRCECGRARVLAPSTLAVRSVPISTARRPASWSARSTTCRSVTASGHVDVPSDGGRLAVVTDLYVEPEARGVGLGEAIMNHLVAWATDEGCFGVDSQALPGDRHTKNFFESFGLVARSLVVHRDLAMRGGPDLVVGAIIVRDASLLLIRRGNEPEAGHWAPPGGAIETGETIREAVVREVAEETGPDRGAAARSSAGSNGSPPTTTT